MQAPWGRALRCRPLLEIAAHLFTARDLRLRDDPCGWKAIAGAMDVTPEKLLVIRQVHGADVAVVRRNRPAPWALVIADDIVSDDPDAAVCVQIADCAPILIGDRRLGVVGAAHAGWRGTIREAAPAAVRAMTEEFGSNPADLVAAIGPCLGGCCGEVGDEVPQAFRDAGHGQVSIDRWFSPGPSGRAYLDLGRANRDQLEAAGIPPADIHIAGLCTKTHATVLHSYRADGAGAGRMAAVIRASRVSSPVPSQRHPSRGWRAGPLPC